MTMLMQKMTSWVTLSLRHEKVVVGQGRNCCHPWPMRVQRWMMLECWAVRMILSLVGNEGLGVLPWRRIRILLVGRKEAEEERQQDLRLGPWKRVSINGTYRQSTRHWIMMLMNNLMTMMSIWEKMKSWTMV